MPPIDPATFPDVAGERISRTAVTGEAGVVVAVSRPVSLFAHYVRSYRHPNLEELLFSGPATAGNIVPNIGVEPETGHNVDVGAKFRVGNAAGSIGYFVNRYANFISTEEVADSPEGSISQAMNLASVRIQGIEAAGETQFVAGGLTWSPQRIDRVDLRHGALRDDAADGRVARRQAAGQHLAVQVRRHAARRRSIRPVVGGLRPAFDGGHLARSRRSCRSRRFSSPRICLGLDGFTVQRVAAGYNWRAGAQRVGLTLAIDNLTDRFYREQFQFAPARGRSVTLAVSLRGVK